jgi:hypothetical protein
VDQELLSHPEYLISLPVLIGNCVSQASVFLFVLCVRVAKSKAFCVVSIFAYFLIHCDFILKQTFASIPITCNEHIR